MSFPSQLSRLRGRFLWRSFQRRTNRPEAAQQELLNRLLAANRDTAFGRCHGFSSMATTKDFQEGVPVGDYETYRPWIDQVIQGEHRVLTADQPYMFTLTSGTGGQPKLIPVNRSTKTNSSRLSALWLYRALADHPQLLEGKALAVVSPAVEGHTATGIPFGSASGHIYQHASWYLRRRYAVPYDVFAIKDFEAKYYTIMRIAIEQNVSFIATPNPSTILRLVTTADHNREQIIRDIYDGTLSAKFDIETVIRQQLKSTLNPNVKRARELEAMLTSNELFAPWYYWPNLKLVGCWKGGSVGTTISRIEPWFRPGMPFRDIGYLSSEAQVTLPVQDAGSAGILALDSNFYEFIPEADIDSSNPTALTVGQLQAGESYYILITSPTGLYRYDINDVVKVSGYYQKTPILEFVRKGRDMVNLEGEKLHVGQLIQAVESAQRSTGVKVEYFRGVGNVGASRYDLKLELAEGSLNDELVKQLGREIDSRLAELNIEYDQKRRSGRLHAPHVQVMAKGWSSRRVKAKLDRGLRDVQFKDNLLGLPDEEDRPSDVIRDLSL